MLPSIAIIEAVLIIRRRALYWITLEEPFRTKDRALKGQFSDALLGV